MSIQEIENFFKEIYLADYLKYLESLTYGELFQHKRIIIQAIDNKDKKA